MYTKESARRLIKKNGVQYFINLIFSSNFSTEILKNLEEEGIYRNGRPCLSMIYALAY